MRHVYPCTTPSPHYHGPQRSRRTRDTHPYLLILRRQLFTPLPTAGVFKRVPPRGIPCSTYGAKSREPRRWSPGHSSYSWHSVPSRGPHRWSPGSPQIGTLSCCCGRQVRFMVTRGWQVRPKLSASMALELIFKVPKAGTPRSRRCTQPAPPPPSLAQGLAWGTGRWA